MSSLRSVIFTVSGVIAAGYAGQRLATSSTEVIALAPSKPVAVRVLRQLTPLQPPVSCLPDPQAVALEQRCLQLAATLPTAAAQMAASASPPQDELLVRIVEAWTQQDAPSALTWIRLRQDATQRTSLLGRAAIALSEHDPQAAADLIAREINAGHECQQALTAIVGIWSRNDPCAVATWLSQFPESQMLDVSVENLIDSWAFSDPQAAHAWLAKLSLPTAREAGFAILAHHSHAQPSNAQ